MTSVVLYARQSRTDDRDRSASLDAQESDLRALAERRGWRVDSVFRDPDAPADALERRAGWMDLLDHVDAHDVAVVAVFDTSRLWRSVELRYVMLRDLRDAGVTTVATLAGDTPADPTDDPEGELVGVMLAAVAQYDNRLRSLKLRRTNVKYARKGRPTSGGTRPYGYETDRVTVVEHEAAVVREAARRVLGGEAVGTICRDLTDRGEATVTGRPWRTTVLRRVLTSPRTAGLREHRGEVVADAKWEPLLDPDTWERVRSTLLDPRRRKGGRPREYLLTGGVAVCGIEGCGTPLVARPRGDGRRCYVCPSDDSALGFAGCGRIRCLADPLEREVAERLFARLDGEGLRAVLSQAAETAELRATLDALHADEEALLELEVAHFTDRRLSQRGYHEAHDRLTVRIDEHRRALKRAESLRVLTDLPSTAAALAQRWDAEPVVWRRRLLAAVVACVTVNAHGTPGRNRFDPDRVAVDWRV